MSAALTLGLLIIGGAQTQPQNFLSYVEAAGVAQEHVVHATPDANPFTGDHVRDFNSMKAKYQELLARTPDGIVVFAYSVGGKFAARLALEEQNVRGLFLIDPMDGPPPLFGDAKRFPVFLPAGASVLNIPVEIIESERGSAGGFLGVPCVSKRYGPDHFSQFVSSPSLERTAMPGAGHTDFLYPPLSPMASAGCAKGTVLSSTTRDSTRELWSEFFKQRVPQSTF